MENHLDRSKSSNALFCLTLADIDDDSFEEAYLLEDASSL